MDATTTPSTDLRLTRPAEPRVTIVIPAKNEAPNLEVILPQLPEVHEVVLVDGHSDDATVDVARLLMPDIRVLRQTRRGKGNALAVGFEAASGDVVVMFDADGSADPMEIPIFIDALRQGADFAKGSRNLSEGGSQDLTGVRSLGNRVLVRLTNLLFGTAYTDLCYGYNAFWLDVLPALELPPTNTEDADADLMLWGDGFEIETLLHCRTALADLSVVEVPSVELPRISGESHLSARRDGTRVLRTLLAEWRSRQATRERARAALAAVAGPQEPASAPAPARDPVPDPVPALAPEPAAEAAPPPVPDLAPAEPDRPAVVDLREQIPEPRRPRATRRHGPRDPAGARHRDADRRATPIPTANEV